MDVINIAAGAYKGYMNARGVEVDPTYLYALWGGGTLVRGVLGTIIDSRAHAERNRTVAVRDRKQFNDFRSFVKSSSLSGLVTGLDILLGYGLGYATSIVFS